MTYAQAINEAKQMILQQQARIKSDADRIRSQQQTIVDQSSSLAESERRLREQSAELDRMVDESQNISSQLQQMTTAKEQAEAVVDRQGVRLTQMQEQTTELERRVADHASRMVAMSTELENLRSQLPSRDDQDALASMSDLLSKRSAAIKARRGVSAPSMRLAGDESDSGPIAEAA